MEVTVDMMQHGQPPPKIVILTQARLGSTRLPGKILKSVCGKTLLEHHVERLQRSRLAHEVMVATTLNPLDDQVVALCKKRGFPFFRGSENDVLDRYYQAAASTNANVVVRVTSDCPLIDPAVVDLVIERFLGQRGSADYVSNVLQRTYPRGMDTEVFTFTALEEASTKARLPAEREHVTPYMHKHARLSHVTNALDLSEDRWTVDTAEDFELVSRILSALYPAKPEFTMEDILTLLEQHPDWKLLNRHVSQKAT